MSERRPQPDTEDPISETAAEIMRWASDARMPLPATRRLAHINACRVVVGLPPFVVSDARAARDAAVWSRACKAMRETIAELLEQPELTGLSDALSHELGKAIRRVPAPEIGDV